MIVLGIDPGLRVTGYGIVRVQGGGGSLGGDVSLVEAGTVRVPAKGDLHFRLKALFDQTSALMTEFGADIVAVEELYSQYDRPRTAILMGHARGVVLLAAAQTGVPLAAYPPARVKRSVTGNGRATKEQVQRMVQSILEMSELPRPSDVADALAVALCHINMTSHGDGVRARPYATAGSVSAALRRLGVRS